MTHPSKQPRGSHLPLAYGPPLADDLDTAADFLRDCETDNQQLYVSAEQAALSQVLTWGEREGTLIRGGARRTSKPSPTRRDFRPRRNARH